MKLTIANTRANITDKDIERHYDYTVANGVVFGRAFTAERHDGQWEANLITDEGEYTLTGVHSRLEGALAKACKGAVIEFGEGFLPGG